MNLIKVIMTIVALSVVLPSYSQKLEARDFKLTSEMVARLKGTEVIDENSGKRAALIKIYTPFPNDILGFDAGLFQILGRKQAGPGEVWLYVPERTQKLSIIHPKYGQTVMWFEGMEAESGSTYSVRLNVEGRSVSLIASADGAKVSVDGEEQGASPVNMHMPIGSHHVRAELGSLLYDDIVTLTADGPTRFTLQMEDENLKFGDVDIDVPGGAELWFRDQREGVGRLRKHLRAGSYVVTSRLPDHEDRTTAFNVEAGKTTYVKAEPPVAMTGWLALRTIPEHGVVVTQADTVVSLLPTMQIPVGNYEYRFNKRGYEPRSMRFRIEKGETRHDTVRLEKIQYVKKTSGYAAVSFAAGGNMGVRFAIGGYLHNVNIEASYTLGLGRSKNVNWSGREDLMVLGDYNYRVDEINAKIGYQLRFAERFGLTPLAGVQIQRLFARKRSFPGNGFTQNSVTAGVRLTYHPLRHIGFFVMPEYGFPIAGKGDGPLLFKKAGITRGGFTACVGISLSL